VAVPTLLAGLVAVVLLASAPAARAHALVVGSNPAPGARIARGPAELRVAFSEAVRPLGPGLTLRGPGGEVRIDLVRHPAGRPDVLAARLPALADGTYLAGWRIVSVDDGHVEAGSFGFAVGSGSGPVRTPAPRQLPTPWQVAGRWLEAAGVLLLVGVVTAALAVWRRPGPVGPDEPRYAALAAVGSAVGAAGLAWQIAAGAATAGGLGPAAVGGFLAASPGTARRSGVELLLLAAVAVLVWRGARRGRRPGLAALAVVAGLVVALALGSHATGLAPRWLFVALEAVHLLVVGAWVGGLVVLALTVAARRATVAVVRRFSAGALWLVLLVAVTGAWQGLAQVRGWAALTGTDYGRVLAVKVAVFLVVLGLAAVARFRLLPRARAGNEEGRTAPSGGLRRLLGAEAAGGAVVVLVAALLANTVPASEVLAAASAARVRGGPQERQLQAGPLRLRVSLEPGTVGRNVLTVQVTDPGGRPADGLPRIPLAVEDEAGRAAPAALSAARVATATYRAATDAFTLAGAWRVGVGVAGAGPDLAARFAVAAAPATSGTPPPDPPDAVVLGGQAGSALVGLTAFSAGDRLVVRVRGGLAIPPAVAPRPLRILGPDGRLLPAIMERCGDGCGEAFVTAALPTRRNGSGPLTVEAVLPGGTARFTLPLPLPQADPAGPAAAQLHTAGQALAASHSYHIHEILSGGLGAAFRTDYQLQAPDRARWHLTGPDGTSDTVWMGDNRYTRDGRGPWKHEQTPGLSLAFPARNWSDQAVNVTDLGPATWHGTPVEMLAFLDLANGAYHRLWVDHANRIRHERMDAPGHFMDRDYTDYGVPVTIIAPSPS